jgi:hypothetical protein
MRWWARGGRRFEQTADDAFFGAGRSSLLPDAQIVFPRYARRAHGGKLIHKRMMESVHESLADRDVLIWMVDAALPLDPGGPGGSGIDRLAESSEVSGAEQNRSLCGKKDDICSR